METMEKQMNDLYQVQRVPMISGITNLQQSHHLPAYASYSESRFSSRNLYASAFGSKYVNAVTAQRGRICCMSTSADALLGLLGCFCSESCKMSEGVCGNVGEVGNADTTKQSKGGSEHPDHVLSPRRSPRLLALAGQRNEHGHCSNESGADNDHEVAPPPAVGMVFSTLIDVEMFYKRYAQQQGFGVTRTQGSYSARKERRATTWRCECWGDPEFKTQAKSRKRAKGVDAAEEEEGEVRKRNTKKCFCTAMVYASLNDERLWEIRKVVLDHLNHKPEPSMAMLVKEYRMVHFNRSVKRRLLNDTQVGVSVAQIHSAMARERGGYDNMPLTEKDLRHEKNKVRRLRMEGGDSNALIIYFDKMQKDNPAFFHTHRLDDEGKMKDILWVDARSRAAYEEFSDVVCFDTTYLTNEYTLPFANFVGVNHHGQTILFGCALISSETCETFEWVFTKWLMCMNGKQPGGILTDQAAAFRRPLEDVMPNTRHRWCIWHILQKLTSKVGNFDGVADFKDELLEVIYNSMNRAEFESGWATVISKYGLQENEWLSNLFEERHMWVPSYMTDHFWAGMRTTQRVESIHSFFDKFVNRHTMLHEFGEKYIAAVEKRIADEKAADAKSQKWVRNYSIGYSVERFFRKIYTNNKFRAVQKECERLTYVEVREENNIDDKQFQYLIEDRVWVLPKGCSDEVVTARRTFYCVRFNSETQEAFCDCKMFETHGIMCRHLIRIYYRNRIDNVPKKYVLRRWRKDITRKHSHIKVAHHDQTKTQECRRLDKLLICYEPVTDLAVKTDRLSLIVQRRLKELEVELLEAMKEEAPSTGTGGGASRSVGGSSIPSLSKTLRNPSASGSHGFQSACSDTGVICTEGGTPTSNPPAMKYAIKDPPIPKKKGRPQTTRFKAASEKGSKKKKSKSSVKDKKAAPEQDNTPQLLSQGLLSQPCFSSEVVSTQPSKMPIKRNRKTVSFVDSEQISTPDLAADDDDLLQQNLLSFT